MNHLYPVAELSCRTLLDTALECRIYTNPDNCEGSYSFCTLDGDHSGGQSFNIYAHVVDDYDDIGMAVVYMAGMGV
jgi:hypothetical protein